MKIKEDNPIAKISPLILCLDENDLKTENILQFKEKLYQLMKPFTAFLVIIKTNFGQIIASLVDSKFESTRGMKLEINGKKYRAKLINNMIIYYFLDDQLVKCTWKH